MDHSHNLGLLEDLVAHLDLMANKLWVQLKWYCLEDWEGKLVVDLCVADYHHQPQQGDHHLVQHQSLRGRGDHPLVAPHQPDSPMIRHQEQSKQQHQLGLGVEIHHELDPPIPHVHHSLPPILTHQVHVVLLGEELPLALVEVGEATQVLQTHLQIYYHL